MPAEVSWPIEIGEEEFRRVVETAAVEQILMGAREPRRLPCAKQDAPLAEGRILDDASAQLGGPVELRQQQLAKGLLRHRAAFNSATS